MIIMGIGFGIMEIGHELIVMQMMNEGYDTQSQPIFSNSSAMTCAMILHLKLWVGRIVGSRIQKVKVISTSLMY
jgi:hypothetical protein